ncbi:MAG: putative transposase, partial [Cellvibrionaceae bacterium]
MPMKPRFYLPNVPVHIVQRDHSREPVFFEDQDYATYAYDLKESSEKYRAAIHTFFSWFYTVEDRALSQ